MAITSDVVTEQVEFPSGADVVRGYLARPSGPGAYPALVQVHEVLGITEHREVMTRRLASQGILTLTPNLFTRVGGRPPQDYQTSEERRRTAFLAVPDEQAARDLVAARGYLAGRADVYAD